MKKSFALILALLLFLAGCGSAESAPSESPAEAAMPELEKTDWLAVSTDAAVFDLEGSFKNPNFCDLFQNLDTVPLDQLVAFSLAADGAASEGACEELRCRFLEAPNTVLAYLVLMGDQKADIWDNPPAAEVICDFIACADFIGQDRSVEFAETIAACRELYPSGPAAKLLDILEEKHASH